MYIYFCRMLVAGDAYPVMVVDGSSAVFLRVGDDVNEVVRNVSGEIPQAFIVIGHDVTLHVKGVESGIQDGVFPDVFAGNIHAGFLRGGENGPDVE